MQTTDKWKPTARHDRLHDAFRQLGGIIYPEGTRTQLHHVAGASARHNKEWIGQVFVLVLPEGNHDTMHPNPSNVSTHKHEFEDKYGSQKGLFNMQFLMLVGAIATGQIKLDTEDLPDVWERQAIQEYRR